VQENCGHVERRKDIDFEGVVKMITYRKKALKVHNIAARYADNEYYTETVARRLKEFVESGEYRRIVDIFIYGRSDESLVCSIIYED